ncbi:formylglycine-generating enzyme family protein [Leptothoe sp. LEGE 181152]|uniref:Formylglycine-generating enzyme family protein n=1 Tax=Adonisia turfae CCMR0081 TaxID=2292702 RepID=A0A6M0RJP7_9CYAN|nr:formylglycine-generating enzyme family protein [Adonisia turfae]MDV3347359.1 formylglycine-generating enzyme family protein [Leptothoe sp. LEGE 181152]NEZ55881.1 formylglycine-generating enzyme family protein [Adonisia turfae CCMR0081]
MELPQTPQHKRQSKTPEASILPQSSSRRDMLKFLGFAVVGSGTTLGSQLLLQGCNTTKTEDLAPDISTETTSNSLTQETGTQTTANTPTGEPLQRFDFESVKVDAKGQIIQRPSGSVEYFDEPFLLGKLGNALPLRMVKIPAGSFTIGSPETEEGRDDDEGPQKQVTISSFYMGMFVITQRQYQEIMGENPSRFTQDGDNRPVEKVSWNSADTFCQRLSEQTGRTYRLPSEAEWEYACRAGTTTPFCFGETITTEIANYYGEDTAAKGTYGAGPKGAYRESTVHVNFSSPNAFGLFNMHGNVWEWCAEDYHNSYNNLPLDGSIRSSTDSYSDAFKVLRGGSWHYSPSYSRSASRLHDIRPYRSDNVFGCRVVCMPST